MAIDIIARGLATSLLDSSGKISSDKLPTIGAAPDGATFHPIGGITDSAAIEGKTAEEILLMMLYGVTNPTLIPPSLLVQINNSLPLVAGENVEIVGTLKFNRGAISPAYGTSGYRAGAPEYYLINNEKIESNLSTLDFSFNYTPLSGSNHMIFSVVHGEGEQPYNSTGAIYDSPYPAGTCTQSIVLDAVYAVYDLNHNKVDFVYFTEDDGEGYEVIMLSEAVEGADKQSFAIANNMTVVGIKQYDVLAQDWLWIGGSAEASLGTFDKTEIHKDNLGEIEDYVLYTHNGSARGVRQLRVYITNN